MLDQSLVDKFVESLKYDYEGENFPLFLTPVPGLKIVESEHGRFLLNCTDTDTLLINDALMFVCEHVSISKRTASRAPWLVDDPGTFYTYDTDLMTPEQYADLEVEAAAFVEMASHLLKQTYEVLTSQGYVILPSIVGMSSAELAQLVESVASAQLAGEHGRDIQIEYQTSLNYLKNSRVWC